jgi:hypothetical protein
VQAEPSGQIRAVRSAHFEFDGGFMTIQMVNKIPQLVGFLKIFRIILFSMERD